MTYGRAAASNRRLADFDENIIPFNFNGIALDAHRRIHRRLARRNVVSPTVPWTCNDLAVQLAFAEWAAAVQADVVDGEEFAVNVGNCHRFAIKLKFPN